MMCCNASSRFWGEDESVEEESMSYLMGRFIVLLRKVLWIVGTKNRLLLYKRFFCFARGKNGRRRGIRTHDPLGVNEVL